MGTSWRWRKCPNCRVVERASAFAPTYNYQGWGTGAIPRRCPGCSYEGPTSAFTTVRERHAATYSGGTASPW